MGFFFSKSESTPPPPPPPVPVINNSEEVKKLTQEFQAKYPEIMTSFNNLSAQENISEEDRKIIQTKYANEVNKVPVPTVDQLYTFMISIIKQYSIQVTPTDEQVKKLLEDFGTKYPDLQVYLTPVKSLPDDQQADADMQVNIFLSTYPLGTLDEFYTLSVNILKKYNLPTPTTSQSNITGFQDYGKISMKMDPILKNRSLVEESYSSFSR